MRRVLAALAVTSLLTSAVTGCSAAASDPAASSRAAYRAAIPPASFYLALGDSLSQGVQPNPAGDSVETRDGYPNQLYAVLRHRQPGLHLVKLGCPGETTATMIHGGICSYHGGSQLAAAVGFLRAHRGRVALITIDIGANDPDSCITQLSAARLALCVGKAIPLAAVNLAVILTRLRAADPGGRIIAMNYYLPVLADWRDGFPGELLARLGELAARTYNAMLSRVYRAFGVRVANVFSAFHTADFTQYLTLHGLGSLPRNVATICQWTWECAAPPRGPNEHANQTGYQVIAHAFLLADTGQPAPRQR